MKKTIPPFMLSRYEYEPENSHLYFLPSDLMARLSQLKPAYLIGTRGTGKTTLLQSLNWRERVSNHSLARALGGSPFADGCIGVYLKIPDTNFRLVSDWAAALADQQRGSLLSLYLDLLWLELALEAVSELRLRDEFGFSVAAEHEAVAKISEFVRQNSLSDGSVAKSTVAGVRTLLDLRGVFVRLRKSVEYQATSSQPATFVADLPLTQIGGFGRRVGSLLCGLCSAWPVQRQWHFKVCIDECETLRIDDLLIVNSMVRLAADPVFYVAAFVSFPEDPVTTLLPSLTLSEADRQTVVLDEMRDTSFREFAAGVCNIRVQYACGAPDVIYDGPSMLGPLDINGLLKRILDRSVSVKAKELLREAEGFTGAFRAASQSNSPPQSPPIYQTYLMQALKYPLPRISSTWERRKDESARYRKRMVAAYLSICREVGADVRYATYDMILQMSDNCIRDFLSFLHEIYLESQLELMDFVDSPIDWETQNAAICRASANKRSDVPKRASNHGEVARLADALGRITAVVQTSGPEHRHLVSSERGDFRLYFADCVGCESLLGTIREAAKAGYLRLLGISDEGLRFRVHTSLAAHYGFSYRGAYSPTRLDPRVLQRIIGLQQREFDEQVSSLAKALAGAPVPVDPDDDRDPNQPNLFDGLR